MDILKFTAWFEVNPTFGSRDIRFLKPSGQICTPHDLIRVKVELDNLKGEGVTSRVLFFPTSKVNERLF